MNSIKYLTQIFTLLFTLILLNGCEDVIEVELDSAQPKIVIDAKISDGGFVKITKSTDFYKPGKYEKVQNAIVTVKDNLGNIYTFNEVSDGVYKSDYNNIGKPGRKYFMTVLAEGKEYNATSTMPNYIMLDSLSLEKAPSKPREKGLGRYYIHAYFQDDPEVKNYCRFKLYKNRLPLTGFTLYRDRLMEGNYIDFKIIIDTEQSEIKLNDVITVELMSIDESAYYFYKTATNVNASASFGHPSSTSVAQANPITNWNNNALGVFSAYTSSRKWITIVK